MFTSPRVDHLERLAVSILMTHCRVSKPEKDSGPPDYSFHLPCPVLFGPSLRCPV